MRVAGEAPPPESERGRPQLECLSHTGERPAVADAFDDVLDMLERDDPSEPGHWRLRDTLLRPDETAQPADVLMLSQSGHPLHESSVELLHGQAPRRRLDRPFRHCWAPRSGALASAHRARLIEEVAQGLLF